MAGGPAAFVGKFAQRFHEPIVGMDGRRERRASLILQPRETAEIEIIRTGRGPRQRTAAHDYEGRTGHAVQTLIGGPGDGAETRIAKIERLGAEAAHAVDHESHAASAANLAEGRELVEPAGGGL